MVAEIRRSLPWWTLTSFTLVLGCALYTDSLWHTLSPHTLAHWGYASRHLASESWRILASPFLTHGGAHAYFALVMIPLCVGALETRAGTAAALFVFWTAHIGTVVVAHLLYTVALHAGAQAGVVADIYNASDVGASAGYFGCLSAAAAIRFPAYSGRILLSLVSVFAVALAWHWRTDAAAHTLSADLAHALAVLIALPLGLLLRRRITPASSVRAD